jgi:hypothetical protein
MDSLPLPPANNKRSITTLPSLPSASESRSTSILPSLPSASGQRSTSTLPSLPSASGQRSTSTLPSLPSASESRSTVPSTVDIKNLIKGKKYFYKQNKNGKDEEFVGVFYSSYLDNPKNPQYIFRSVYKKEDNGKFSPYGNVTYAAEPYPTNFIEETKSIADNSIIPPAPPKGGRFRKTKNRKTKNRKTKNYRRRGTRKH